MNNLKATLSGLITVLISTTAQAGYFDGKHQLLCTANEVYQCDFPEECQNVSAEEVSGARQILLNFKKKELTATNPNSQLKSEIDRVEIIDNTLFVQGMEDGSADRVDGAAWSISIGDPDGMMVVSISAGNAGFVLLGACTPYDG